MSVNFRDIESADMPIKLAYPNDLFFPQIIDMLISISAIRCEVKLEYSNACIKMREKQIKG